MKTYISLLPIIGTLFVMGGGLTALFLILAKKLSNVAGATVAGIGAIIGLILMGGDRITELTTPLGTIKAVAKEANQELDDIKEIARDILKLKVEAQAQAAEVEATKKHSASIMDDMKRDFSAFRAEIKDTFSDIPIMMQIVVNEDKLASHRHYVSTLDPSIERDKKQIQLFQAKIQYNEKENELLRKMLRGQHDAKN
ncbi:MAG: hypothetical protein MN733_42065 [Nitrososphaera sp.]|nr:hypothetical protein [Nitrososphaera sp.]